MTNYSIHVLYTLLFSIIVAVSVRVGRRFVLSVLLSDLTRYDWEIYVDLTRVLVQRGK